MVEIYIDYINDPHKTKIVSYWR